MLNTIPVTVKHKDGSRTSYKVLARNILHKTMKTHETEQMRERLIAAGTIKPAPDTRVNIASGEDVVC